MTLEWIGDQTIRCNGCGATFYYARRGRTGKNTVCCTVCDRKALLKDIPLVNETEPIGPKFLTKKVELWSQCRKCGNKFCTQIHSDGSDSTKVKCPSCGLESKVKCELEWED